MDFVGNIHDRVAPPPPAYPGKSTRKSVNDDSMNRKSVESMNNINDTTPELEISAAEIIVPELPKTPRVNTAQPIAQSTPVQRNSFSSTISVDSQRSTNSSVRSLADKMTEPCSPHRTPESFWYKPSLSREETVNILKQRKSGDFIVRDSNSYRLCYGLAVRVEKHQIPKNLLDNLKAEPSNELVRHFLIETSGKGVRVSGGDREPYFPSLAALINQHAHTPLSLPVKLNIPSTDICQNISGNGSLISRLDSLRETTASYSLYFLHETDTEMLTGDAAIIRCSSEYFSKNNEIVGKKQPDCLVNFKVSAAGITVTDTHRKRFFRKHFPSETVSHCGYDSNGTKIRIGGQNCNIFGIVSKKSSSNLCVIFAELEKPDTDIIQFVNKVMLQSSIVSDFNGTY